MPCIGGEMDNERNKYRVAVVGGAGMWGRHYLQTFAERKKKNVQETKIYREVESTFCRHHNLHFVGSIF